MNSPDTIPAPPPPRRLRWGMVAALTVSAASLVLMAIDPMLRSTPAVVLVPLCQVSLFLLFLTSLVDATRRRPRNVRTAVVCALTLSALQFGPWESWYWQLLWRLRHHDYEAAAARYTAGQVRPVRGPTYASASQSLPLRVPIRTSDGTVEVQGASTDSTVVLFVTSSWWNGNWTAYAYCPDTEALPRFQSFYLTRRVAPHWWIVAST